MLVPWNDLLAIFFWLLLFLDAEAAKGFCVDLTSDKAVPREFDDTVANCTDGKVVFKITTTPVPTTPVITTTPVPTTPVITTTPVPTTPVITTTPVPTTTVAMTTPKLATIITHSYSRCNLDPERSRAGYRCCAYEKYHPDFSTCCQQSSWKKKIHENKKQAEHVCCGLEAYRRHDAPCRRNPGKNDKLWSAEVLKRSRSICELYNYAFVITIGQKKDHAYSCTVEQLYASISAPGRNVSKITRDDLMIPIDDYSPTDNLTGRTFFAVSEQNYLDDRFLDVFFGNNDMVHLVPKKMIKRLPKTVKRMFRKCEKKQNRQRHPGRKRHSGRRQNRRRTNTLS